MPTDTGKRWSDRAMAPHIGWHDYTASCDSDPVCLPLAPDMAEVVENCERLRAAGVPHEALDPIYEHVREQSMEAMRQDPVVRAIMNVTATIERSDVPRPTTQVDGWHVNLTTALAIRAAVLDALHGPAGSSQ